MSKVSILIVRLTLFKVTRNPCKLPTDVQKVQIFQVNLQDTYYYYTSRLKQYSSQSLMTMSTLLYSLSRALEVLQACLALVGIITYHI
jgi:hypothetical protein